MQTETPEKWSALFDAIGGRARLAARCFVSESTVWRWSREETEPSVLQRAHVDQICDELEVERVFETRKVDDGNETQSG